MNRICSDYRCLENEELNDLVSEKVKLLQYIKQTSKYSNMYNAISKRDDPRAYNKHFFKIYKEKCAYCGVSIEIIDSNLFEIDHFICESHSCGLENPHELSNLICSCYTCNRGKHEFEVKMVDEESKENYNSLLHPDFSRIKEVFVRKSNYRIEISDNYKNDGHITEFYEKLMLSHESRRLDYLLLQIKDVYKNCSNQNLKGKLAQIVIELQTHRNRGYINPNY